MSASAARLLRRAAERQALKTEPKPVSEAQIAANRANSLNSTGPRTPEGLAAISLNAVKTGLTGRTVLLPSDDAALYQSHILAYEKQFKPVGPEECALVQSLADLRWRLNRIPGLEMALINRGRLELPPDTPEMLELDIMLKYEKQFRNLHLQEARLARRREKEMAELRRLQQERKANEADALERATSAHLLAIHRNQPADPPEIGFEFSKQTFDAHIATFTRQKKEEILQKALANAAEPPETMLAKPASTGRPETMQATA